MRPALRLFLADLVFWWRKDHDSTCEAIGAWIEWKEAGQPYRRILNLAFFLMTPLHWWRG